ncbi:MAG TPA: hypothetical protein VF493_19290 [Terriglobales bacterium]
MNKLFGLFLLAIAFLAPVPADAACAGGNCFWIGGTGTVDGTSDNGHWATSSGGASCACVPNTTDTVTFDGSSGTGTVTINMGGALWTTGAFSMSAAASLTIEFSTNNNSWLSAAGGFSASGASTKTLNMGSGTFTIQSASANWDTSGSGLTLNAGTSTISFTATTGTGGRRFFTGNKTYATVSVAGNATNNFYITSSGNPTIGTLTIAAPNTVHFTGGITYTVTTFTNIVGTSSTAVLFDNEAPLNGRAIISSANNWSCTWCGFTQMQFQGGGSFSAPSSFAFANISGISPSPPSAGGGGGRIIGG